MAGIYLHIPFCKSRCIYCDFYSTLKTNSIESYITTLSEELKQRKDYLQDPIKTIYLGGGTPSLLSYKQLGVLFKNLDKHYNLSAVKEVTLEANPDDLTPDYLNELRKLPINRLSIGIQSFHDNHLQKLHRRHTAQKAIEAVHKSQDVGFDNISIDLIYGLPNETLEEWKEDIQQAINLNIQHISAYHLIYEKSTPLFQLLTSGKIQEVNEELSLDFFSLLIDELNGAGFEHYEISNFSKPSYQSQHNSSYWNGTHYLGCGPSAHSFNGTSREWNIASLTQYIKGIKNQNRLFQTEHLDTTTQYNEYVITSIRRSKGADLKHIKKAFGVKYYNYILKYATPHIKNNTLEVKNDILKLTKAGIFISDGIMSDLLFII